MMAKIKDVLESVGSNSANYASRIGCRTSALARSIGPKRGGIALGVLAVAIATPFIIRAIRARREEDIYDVDEDFSADPAAAHKPAAKKSGRKSYRRARGTNAPPV